MLVRSRLHGGRSRIQNRVGKKIVRSGKGHPFMLAVRIFFEGTGKFFSFHFGLWNARGVSPAETGAPDGKNICIARTEGTAAGPTGGSGCRGCSVHARMGRASDRCANGAKKNKQQLEHEAHQAKLASLSRRELPAAWRNAFTDDERAQDVRAEREGKGRGNTDGLLDDHSQWGNGGSQEQKRLREDANDA